MPARQLHAALTACAAIVVGSAAFAPTTSAAADEPTIGLSYSSEADCPGRDAFVRQVQGRTDRLRLAGGAHSEAWVVTTHREPDGSYTGRLAVRDVAGAERARDVSGVTCGEVVAALALVAALTVDPSASTKRTKSDDAADASVGAGTSVEPPSPKAMEASSSDRRRWQLGVGVRGGLEVSATPSTVSSLGGLVEVRTRRPGIWSPAVGAAFVRTFETSASVSGSGSADFVLTMGTLDLCPSRADLTVVSLSGCLRGELGVVHADGRGVTPAREQSRLWAALDGLLRVEVTLIMPLSLAIYGGVRVPVVRTQYFFQPDTPLFRTPAIGGFGGLELIARFL